jgi:hypothetical protein
LHNEMKGLGRGSRCRLMHSRRWIGRMLVVAGVGVASVLAACEAPASRDRGNEKAADSAIASEQERAARQVVEQFGARMQTVSLLAPDSMVPRQLREAYGPLVTPELLALWTAQPDSAPGRRVSSPWPDRIEVASVRPLGEDTLEVSGTLRYKSSADAAGASPAASEPVTLRVVRVTDGSWRIGAYAEDARTGK